MAPPVASPAPTIRAAWVDAMASLLEVDDLVAGGEQRAGFAPELCRLVEIAVSELLAGGAAEQVAGADFVEQRRVGVEIGRERDRAYRRRRRAAQPHARIEGVAQRGERGEVEWSRAVVAQPHQRFAVLAGAVPARRDLP